MVFSKSLSQTTDKNLNVSQGKISILCGNYVWHSVMNCLSDCFYNHFSSSNCLLKEITTEYFGEYLDLDNWWVSFITEQAKHKPETGQQGVSNHFHGVF